LNDVSNTQTLSDGLMRDIFEHMVHLLEQGESFVLATIFSRTGSAPRTAGARMLIHADGSIVGTIGGGLLEARVQQTAPQVFQDRRAQVQAFNLTSKDASQMDMICGGQVEVLVDFIDAADDTLRLVYPALLTAMKARQRAWLLTTIPSDDGQAARCMVKEDGTVVGEPGIAEMVGIGAGSPIGLFGGSTPETEELPDIASSRYPVLIDHGGQRLLVEPIHNTGTVYIFGAGHISQRLAPLTGMVGFSTVVLDDRPEFANRERFDTADQVIVIDSFEGVLDRLPIDRDSYLVVVTRGHMHDKTVLAQALRTRAGYIGMIGSHGKRDATYRALSQEGFGAEDFARVHSPIGLAIGAESPEEIAVCIAAELIKVRAEAR
jgi:xanthine dehydrogenase accessory factor